MPRLRNAYKQQTRGYALGGCAERIRADHDEVSRQPVTENAADQDKDDLRQPTGGEHVAEVRRRPRQVEDREGKGDRCDRGSE